MKQNARIMLLMAQEINEKHVARVRLEGDIKPVTVTCFTCHRGQKQPVSKTPLPPPMGAPPAAPSPPPPNQIP